MHRPARPDMRILFEVEEEVEVEGTAFSPMKHQKTTRWEMMNAKCHIDDVERLTIYTHIPTSEDRQMIEKSYDIDSISSSPPHIL